MIRRPEVRPAHNNVLAFVGDHPDQSFYMIGRYCWPGLGRIQAGQRAGKVCRTLERRGLVKIIKTQHGKQPWFSVVLA